MDYGKRREPKVKRSELSAYFYGMSVSAAVLAVSASVSELCFRRMWRRASTVDKSVLVGVPRLNGFWVDADTLVSAAARSWAARCETLPADVRAKFVREVFAQLGAH